MWISEFQRWLTEEESLHNAQLVANYFNYWKPESIAALCGNMRHESSINPDMYEYGYAWEDDRGYGLVQWTPRSKYWNWALERGLDPRNGDSQLERIQYEVDNGIQWIPDGHRIRYGRESKYNFTFLEFINNTHNLDVDSLTESFMWNYEGPAYDAGTSSLPNRQAFARRCLQELEFEGGIGPQPPQKAEENLIILLLCDALHGWKKM